jgi:hypothetical protein
MELTPIFILLLSFIFVLVTADMRTAVRIATPTFVETLSIPTNSPHLSEIRGIGGNETAGIAFGVVGLVLILAGAWVCCRWNYSRRR